MHYCWSTLSLLSIVCLFLMNFLSLSHSIFKVWLRLLLGHDWSSSFDKTTMDSGLNPSFESVSLRLLLFHKCQNCYFCATGNRIKLFIYWWIIGHLSKISVYFLIYSFTDKFWELFGFFLFLSLLTNLGTEGTECAEHLKVELWGEWLLPTQMLVENTSSNVHRAEPSRWMFMWGHACLPFSSSVAGHDSRDVSCHFPYTLTKCWMGFLCLFCFNNHFSFHQCCLRLDKIVTLKTVNMRRYYSSEIIFQYWLIYFNLLLI